MWKMDIGDQLSYSDRNIISFQIQHSFPVTNSLSQIRDLSQRQIWEY